MENQFDYISIPTDKGPQDNDLVLRVNRLLFVVLMRALGDVASIGRNTDQAVAWIFENDHDYQFSFLSICKL